MNSITKNAIFSSVLSFSTIAFPFVTVKYASIVLGSEKYGQFAMGKSIISYFILIAGLGVGTYATREGAKVRDDKEALNQFANEVFTINLISTLVSMIILGFLLIIGSLAHYKTVVIVLSTEVLLTTVGVEWVNTIFEDYKYLTYRTVFFQLLALVLMVLFVKKPEDYITYTGISVLSSCGGYAVNAFYVNKYVTIHPVKSFRPDLHLRRIMLLFFNSITSTIYLTSDVTIIGFICGDRDVAIYDISSKIYFAFKRISVALVMVAIPSLSYYFGKEQMDKAKEILLNVRYKFYPLVPPLVLCIAVFSEEIIKLTSSSEYIEGTVTLQILSVAGWFAMNAYYYLNCILLSKGHDTKVVFVTFFSALLNIVLNFLLIPLFGFVAAAITTLISEIFTFATAYILSIKEIRVSFDKVYYLRSCILFIVVFVEVMTVKFFVSGYFWRLLSSGLVVGISYFLYFLCLSNKRIRT